MGTKTRAKARIGTSGYQYDHWRGRFYPGDLPRKRWFAHYRSRFDTVEINNTFYNLPRRETFEDWASQAPRGFRYALKMSRYATHLKRLKDPSQPIAHFLDRARALGPSLGPILVQLPPNWRVDVERLAGFLDEAPNDCRWVVEFRDPSWLCEDVYDVLAEHGAALCVHDALPDHPRRLTARWTYLRFHGDHYTGSYSHQHLSAVATRIAEHLADGVDVYAYFNNDAEANAVRNAQQLARYVRNRNSRST